MTRSPRQLHAILAAAVVLVAAASLAIGTTGVTLGTYWQSASSTTAFFRGIAQLALPRLAMAALAGASLAVAGAMFQALFRNPLASPYTLGVSSGASLGAAIAISLAGGGLWHGLPVVSLAAMAGALVCVSIVYLIARTREGHAIGTLLLAGITIGFICSALIICIMFLAEVRDADSILRWMMGSLVVVGFDPVLESLVLASTAGGVAFYLNRDLDLLMMGETVAAARGVPVRRSRRLIYFGASLLTAAVVAHCGPIGFVGLLVPHMARALVGPSHRHLLPACALAGAAFLPLCDLLARNAMWWIAGESRQIPVGVLTNIVGGGFLLYLLLARKADRAMM